MDGVNIFSGSKGIGGALTNPPELSFRKGSIVNHYPVTFRGWKWKDAEGAYQSIKRSSPYMSMDECMKLLEDIDVAKFQQYPRLVQAINHRGGVEWLKKCRHRTGARTKAYSQWEGEGENSPTIVVLIRAYQRVASLGS